MYRLILFLYFLLPVLATTSNEECELNKQQLEQTPNNKWIVVNWEKGGCYYHHTEDRVNVDRFPSQ